MARKVSYRQELVDNNIELSVRHLKQFFKFGHGASSLKTKAVHDISFDIKKGECFGLVGESGCGKTTTGRSLIRLYHITSGSVYFEGYRISAGKRWNEKEIKWTKYRAKHKIRALKKKQKQEIYYSSIPEDCKNAIIEEIENYTKLKSGLTYAKSEYQNKLFENEEIEDIFEKETADKKAKAEYKEEKKAIALTVSASKKIINNLRKNAVNKENKSRVDQSQAALDAESIRAKYKDEIAEIIANRKKVVKEQKEIIKQIDFDNKHVDKKLMSKMQMIFQDPVDSLDPRMTVEDIIQEGLHIQGQHNKFANSKKVAEVLEKVGLIPEYASRYPHEFSGGQRQRIGIARALVMNPSFLICDEPISALDVSIRAQIINLLNDLKEEMGLTIMFIAHDLSVVKYFCDRIAVMYFGEMVELATSEELFKHPLHPYSQALLSAIPKPDPLTEKTRKRIVYNPKTAHDYSREKPKLQEILPGHFILANSEEMEKYRAQIKELDAKAKK